MPKNTYLRCPLEVLRAVAVDVVVRTDGFLQFVADDQTRSLGSGTSREDHDASASVGERRLFGIRDTNFNRGTGNVPPEDRRQR